MLDFNKIEGPRPKCYYTTSTLPAFVNHDQIPRKKKPFSTIQNQVFNHTLAVLIPEKGAAALEKSLGSSTGILRYLTVYMKLSELIEGDFFNRYIKSGNILMLSEGRPGVDHVFSLSEGILRLEVDKPTFERIGLNGEPISSGGRKHVKARYAIQLNLRLPSMVNGKSGFQRIVWAFKNVLNHSLRWLFCDVKGPNDGSGPIRALQPLVREVKPQSKVLRAVEVPELARDLENSDYEDATELLEWLTMAMSGSPRIQHTDGIDPYLSRYQVLPNADNSVGTAGPKVEDLAIFHWYGFIQPRFVQDVLLATLKASGGEWFALKAAAFNGKAYAFLQNGDRTMMWEYQD